MRSGGRDDAAGHRHERRGLARVGVDHRVDDVRLHPDAPVGDRVHRGQHLHRRGHETLTEGCLGVPEVIPGRLRPQRDAGLAGQVDPGRGTDPEGEQVVVEGVLPLHLLCVDGPVVEGVIEHPLHGDVAVRAAIPVVDEVAVDPLLALVDHRARREGVVVEATGEGDDLHDRPGLVGLGHREVAEVRKVRRCEIVGVVGGVLGPRVNGSRLGIHDHQGARRRLRRDHPVGKRELGRVLDLRVERQLQVIAIFGSNLLLLAEHDRIAVDVGQRGLVSVDP